MAHSAVQIAAPAPRSPQESWSPFRLRGRPFFEDKNRAFWTLQTIGWTGYFVLRTLSGIANAMGWVYVLHTLLLTATGYSLTLLMAAAYRDPVLGLLTPSLLLPDAVVTTDRNRVAQDQPTYLRSKSDQLQATFKVDLDFADLTSYTQFRSERTDQSMNLDNTAAAIFQLGIPVDSTTFSQELLLASKPGGALQWVGGLFYFNNRDIWKTLIDTPAGRIRFGGSGTITEGYAAFLDATYEVSPRFFVTVGARYAHDRVDDAYYNPRFSAARTYVPSISGDRVTPRAVLRYKPSDESSVYASFTRGYKAALIDVGGTCQNLVNIPTPQNPTGAGFTCNDIKPEKIDAYEVGFKYDDRRLSLDLSAFYYDYRNLQVSLFLAGTANIVNAAKSQIYGIEGSIRYEVFDGFQLSAGGSWTGVRLAELIALVGGTAGDRVLVESLQAGGYRSSVVDGPHLADPLTLLALRLNGEPLHIDHGYPCRLIAPNRPGVLQTKWVSAVTVQ